MAYAGAGYIYGPLVVPTVGADNQLSKTEFDTLQSFQLDTQNAVQQGDFTGLRDMSAAPPPVAGAGTIRRINNGGQTAESINGAPYVWIKSVDYINAGDKRFGLNGLGVVDDAAALNAAILATVGANNANKKGVLVLPSDVQIRIRSLVQVGACLGFTMIGSGQWSSQIIVDPTAAGGNGLSIIDSQLTRLEGFGLKGVASNPAGRMLSYDYSSAVSPVNASYGHKLSDLFITGDAALAYDYGIYWSDLYGNNSEVGYFNLQIQSFREAGIILPGTQQKAHILTDCNLNGQWDGVDHTTNGGKIGIRQGGGVATVGSGGSFSMYGGGIGACRVAGISLEYPNDPIDLDDIQSEGCYRFVDMGATPSAGRQPLSITKCRIDVNLKQHAADVVRLVGQGPFTIETNSISAGSTAPLPYIGMAPQFGLSGSVKRNEMKSTNSVTQYAVVVDQSVGSVEYPDVSDNIFTNAAGNATQHQAEHLGYLGGTPPVFPTGVTLIQPGSNQKPMLIRVDRAAFIAAATTQNTKLMDLPKGTAIKHVSLYLYEQFAAPSVTVCTMKIGRTSGGNEFLLAADILTTSPKFFGGLAAELGADLAANYTAGQYLTESAYNNATALWMAITATGANVGTGAATRFTTGYFFLLVHLEVNPRFVYVA